MDSFKMLEIYKFDRDEYALLVVEGKGFEPIDIIRIQSIYPEVEGSKGVVIAGSPETDWSVVGDLFSWYRNRSVWQGAYNPKLAGILVSNSFEQSPIRGEVIKAQLPCLQCFRESGQLNWGKPGAKRPYCEKHYEKSPHRKGWRRKAQ